MEWDVVYICGTNRTYETSAVCPLSGESDIAERSSSSRDYEHAPEHSVAHSRLTKISAIARSYRQSSAQPIRLDRYQALLAATHDRGQPQRHHHRQERHRRATGSAPKRLSLYAIGPPSGGCDTLYLKLRPRNAVLGRVLIIATARRSLSDVAFARKWTNSRRLGRSDLCRLGKHQRRLTRWPRRRGDRAKRRELPRFCAA